LALSLVWPLTFDPPTHRGLSVLFRFRGPLPAGLRREAPSALCWCFAPFCIYLLRALRSALRAFSTCHVNLPLSVSYEAAHAMRTAPHTCNPLLCCDWRLAPLAFACLAEQSFAASLQNHTYVYCLWSGWHNGAQGRHTLKELAPAAWYSVVRSEYLLLCFTITGVGG
jgi:hypothetical protein